MARKWDRGMHERVSSGESGWGGGVDGENMLRRGESSWLCMKFEFAFFAGHGIFIRVFPLSFLVLPMNELCPPFLPDPYATSCFVLHLFHIIFPNGIFMLFCGCYEISIIFL